MDTLLAWLKMRLNRIIENKAPISEIVVTFSLAVLCLPLMLLFWVYYTGAYYYQVLYGKSLDRKRKRLGL